MSAQILNLQYFDENKGTWGLRRPKNISPQEQGDRPTYNMVHLNLGISSQLPPEERVKNLVQQYLASVEPSFVTLTEVTNEVSAALAKNTWIRGNYAMTDSVFCIGPALTEAAGPDAKEIEIEQACIVLIRHGINVDFVESLAKQFAAKASDSEPQPIVAIHMRNFLGLGFHTLCALHLDPTTNLKDRLAYLGPVLERLAEKDNVIVSSNFYQNCGPVKDFKVKLLWDLGTSQFSDVTDSAHCTKALSQNPQESSIWFKSRDSRLHVEKAQLLSMDSNAPNVYQSAVVCRFTANPAYVPGGGTAAAAAVGRSSPTPVTAGSGVPQAPLPASASPESSTTAQFQDPAVMSMRNNGQQQQTAPPGQRGSSTYSSGGAEGGVNLASLFGKSTAATAGGGGAAPATPQRQWNAANILPLTRRNNLSDLEREYDQSAKYSSVGQAVDALNSGSAQWSRDYMIIHSTLLASSTAVCTLEAFRNYTQQPTPASTTTSASGSAGYASLTTPSGTRSVGPTPNSVLSAVRGSFLSSQSPQPNPLSGFGVISGGTDRPRKWATSSAVLVHQVTPREMVFDISADVGLGPHSLKKAVDKLNLASPADPNVANDRLANYRYDYALLFSRERRAYWLLSALDVPCDIQACRASCVQLTPQPL